MDNPNIDNPTPKKEEYVIIILVKKGDNYGICKNSKDTNSSASR